MKDGTIASVVCFTWVTHVSEGFKNQANGTESMCPAVIKPCVRNSAKENHKDLEIWRFALDIFAKAAERFITIFSILSQIWKLCLHLVLTCTSNTSLVNTYHILAVLLDADSKNTTIQTVLGR